MCELFAMSSSAPTNVHFSLEEFSRHGGLTGPHKDGWGIAYYSQGDAKLVRETLLRARQRVRAIHPGPPVRQPARDQPHPPGDAGRSYAEQLSAICARARREDARLRAQRRPRPATTALPAVLADRPIGVTDSEYAFCVLLGRFTQLWLSAQGVPSLAERRFIVAAFAAEIRAFGPANFSMRTVMRCSSTRTSVCVSQRVLAARIACHLQILLRCRKRSACRRSVPVRLGHRQHVVLAASVPLTAEDGWRALREGEIIAVHDGEDIVLAHQVFLPDIGGASAAPSREIEAAGKLSYSFGRGGKTTDTTVGEPRPVDTSFKLARETYRLARRQRWPLWGRNASGRFGTSRGMWSG